MKPAEIDQILDAMAAEAAKTGDDKQLPGAIFLHQADYLASGIKTVCPSLTIGMRYRGVRVLVSREFTSQVVARGDLKDDVGEFFPLEPAG